MSLATEEDWIRGVVRSQRVSGSSSSAGQRSVVVSRRAKLLRPFRLGTRIAVSAGANLLYRAVGREPAFPGLLELNRRFYEAVATGGPSPVCEDEMVGSLALIEAVRSRIH